ncbi:MAG: WYL domain-containing protein [Clostridiales bacterium]
MKPFNELIKNFYKIRSYLRSFTIYGYKRREDFLHKSVRTYDNEKRRIQSYFNNFINEQTSLKGKCISINFDYLNINSNPLFEGYKTKSFTKNDIMFHFIILDLLITYEKLTLNNIYEFLLSEYLNNFEECRIFDQRTLRIKINEYIKHGLIMTKKIGKTLFYYLATNPIENLNPVIQEKLLYAISFYQNIKPLGLLGNFILEQYGKENHYHSFRNLHFSHTVDELIIYDLLNAIKFRKIVKLICLDESKKIVLPIKIVDNIEQGRRYVVVYHYHMKQYRIYRIDKIIKIELLETSNEKFEQKLNIVNALLESTWGVALNFNEVPNRLETWDLLLYIEELTEKELLHKIETAHPYANLQRVGIDTFHYNLSISDANEILPWFRQFIGRIISINCTDRKALKRFVNDIKLMKSYYSEVKNNAI